MAKYKKKYYAKKKVLRALGKYSRRKLNYITDIKYDLDGNLFIDGQQQNSFIIGECLTGNQGDFQNLGKQFGFVKLRGILIEAVANNIAGNGYDYGLSICQTNDQAVFGHLRTQPNCLLVSLNGAKSKMYVKVSSEFTSTNDIQLFNNVAIMPFRQGTGAITISLKITMYLTFKTNL